MNYIILISEGDPDSLPVDWLRFATLVMDKERVPEVEEIARASLVAEGALEPSITIESGINPGLEVGYRVLGFGYRPVTDGVPPR